jgi:translation initiation factor IF-2
MSETVITTSSMITVGGLADIVHRPVSQLITELMKNGIMATVNEKIDIDTAQILINELGLDIKLNQKINEDSQSIVGLKKAVTSNDGIERPPIVAVMGHVDHGKTSLLDNIRSTNVVKKEAGGITQHISAYQVKHKDKLITFLDTPGHEAFSAIRQHGARLTDIVIIVIAADDGIKPQTIEALKFAKQAQSKIIIAVNKIDKEGADVVKIKQQLADQDILIEEWGGETVLVEISAKTGQGIDKLLDMILLVAELEELKADIKSLASGLIIEAHLETGRGPVVYGLVYQGILKINDFIIAGQSYGKIRNLENMDGQSIKEAYPSTPVKIVGLKTLPDFGDEFMLIKNEKEAKKIVGEATSKDIISQSINSTELIRRIDQSNNLKKINILIKADVKGSLTSVIDSLKSLETDEVALSIVGSSIGSVNENDLYLAKTTSSIIYGFNISIGNNILHQAQRDHIEIKNYKIIYELIDDVKTRLSGLLNPEIIEKSVGELQIKAIFSTTKSEIICGGVVLSGKINLNSLLRVRRGKDLILESKLNNLKRGQINVKEVLEGELCGLSIDISNQKVEILVDDRVEFYDQDVVERSL